MWMDKEGEIYPLFEYYVAKARASTADPYVVITQDGLSDLGTLEEIEIIKLLYGNQSYILISLKNILEKLCLKVTKPKMLFSLNKNESEILEIIRSEDVDSFKVEMKDGKINNIVTDKVFPGIDLARLTKEMEKSGSYFDITAKYEKGKAQSVKVSLKRKMQSAINKTIEAIHKKMLVINIKIGTPSQSKSDDNKRRVPKSIE